MLDLTYRPRRLRTSASMRALVQETTLNVEDLIYPIFVVPGEGVREPIDSLPGQYHLSVDEAVKLAKEIYDLGILGVEVFGIPTYKDEQGSSAWDMEQPVQQAIAGIRKEVPELIVIGDVCLCQYTTTGHCGCVEDHTVVNDETLPLLAQVAVSQAKAGAQVVAPSDMMDGRVGVIRTALDEAGFTDVAIMSYSAKYASAYYGPFRDAVHSAPEFGDRKGYQMDPANRLEALREIELDIREGADMIIMKPALSYLDIIREARDNFDVPLAAYNVSGEYAMIKTAAAQGLIDEKRIVLETLLSMKRAGCKMIITYHALDVARWLRK
ncbi:porphobilinogen synthase [uncultured Veillonella sp.]|uniref:porphobilinogen synthase n=1 Tax=uncultured Veillonella sp. TaxID=159268 RepID=UPI0025FB40E5|nr:porphobilinogen synthase [uncultured Veillonella sp.]